MAGSWASLFSGTVEGSVFLLLRVLPFSWLSSRYIQLSKFLNITSCAYYIKIAQGIVLFSEGNSLFLPYLSMKNCFGAPENRNKANFPLEFKGQEQMSGKGPPPGKWKTASPRFNIATIIFLPNSDLGWIQRLLLQLKCSGVVLYVLWSTYHWLFPSTLQTSPASVGLFLELSIGKSWPSQWKTQKD